MPVMNSRDVAAGSANVRPARIAAGVSGQAEAPGRRSFWIGAAAALTAVTIWAGWIVVTRFGVTTTLAPYDVAFLRFAIPAVALLPVLLRRGFALRRIGLGASLLMTAGAGAPFFLVSSAGMQFAPAAHVGALLPGTMPLFVAVLAALLHGERFGRGRLVGFGLIVAGIVGIGGHGLLGDAPGQWRGHLMLLAAAALWAGYTLALRRAGIGPWHAAALVSTYSIIGFAPLYLLFLEPRLMAAPWPEVALQAVCQGVLSGIVAMFAYGLAVRHLGPSRASVFSSLTPVAAALLGIPLLAEAPDGPTAIGIAAVSLGVALASGAIGNRPRAMKP